MPAAFARPLITSEKQRRRPQRRAGAEPRRLARGLLLGEGSVLDRPLRRRRARPGEVIKKITNTATNPHYESLSFLTSAGAWDPAGKRFVFPRPQQGRAGPDHRRRRARPDRARDSADRGAARSSTRPGRPTASRSCSRARSAASPTVRLRPRRRDTARRLTTDAFAEMRSGVVARRTSRLRSPRIASRRISRPSSPGGCGWRSWTWRPGP